MTDEQRRAAGLPPEPSPYPQPMAAAMPPVQDFTSTTNYGPQTTQKVRSPQLEAGITEQAAALAEQRKAIEQQKADQAERDNLEAQAARERQQAAIDEQARASAENEERAAAFATAKQQAADARAEMERTNKITDFWEDKGTPAKIFAAVLVGLGEGTKRHGGPSTVMQIFDAAEARDRAEKVRRAGAAKDKSGRADELAAGADAGSTTAQKNLTIARANALAAKLEAAKAQLPSTRHAELDQAAGALRAKAAETTMSLEKDLAATVQSGHSSTTTVRGEKPGSEGNGPPLATRNQGVDEGEKAKAMARYEAIVATPEGKAALAELQTAQKKKVRGDAVDQGGGFAKDLRSLGKMADVVPVDVAGQLKSPLARELYGLTGIIETDFARTVDPSGPLDVSAQARGRDLAGTAYKTPEETARDAATARRKAEERAAVAKGPATAPTDPTSQRTRVTPEIAGALLELRKNPDDADLRAALEARGIPTDAIKPRKAKRN